MGKKSRRNRQKNPEAFKKNQQNAIKKQNTECDTKTRAQGIFSPSYCVLGQRRARFASGGLEGGIQKTTCVPPS